MKQAIGIDLGGTRIKAKVIDEDGNILQQLYTPTNDGDDSVWKKAVADTVNVLRKELNGQVLIGISAPGLPDKENMSIAFMPGRLEGLENFIWENYLQCPAFVLNDAIAALV